MKAAAGFVGGDTKVTCGAARALTAASVRPPFGGMRRRLRTSPISLVTLLVLASPAEAWNNQGHMATGATAYDILTRADPAVVRRVLALAAALPQRQALERGVVGLSGPARDRMVFAYLARWPDDVRNGPLDHPDWHYAVHVVSPGWSLIPYTAGRARQAYDASMATLERPAASDRDKAIAVAWVLHLSGDTQQPLHAGNRMALPAFPKSDRAGTIGYVRNAPGSPPRSLHDAWDSAADVPGDERTGATRIAAKVEGAGPSTLGSVSALRRDPDRAFRTWWMESYLLAQTVAYVGDGLRESPTSSNAPVLSRDYQDRARRVAESRIRLGGLRGAASLAAALDPRAP